MLKRVEKKTLKDEKDEEYLILKVINYKGISCAYAMKVLENNEEGIWFEI